MNPNDGKLRLDALKESYREVLQATKHEDDKIGRFLTAIAFLVAGALLFSQQEGFFEARYDLGDGWPLPTIAMLGFVFSVVFSVLLYILTIAAPVTPPPVRQGDPRRSRLFFQLIAEETPDTWAARWNVSAGEIRDDLVKQYRVETLNLAYRAYTKRNRSTEATHLFAVALLFFLLTIGLGVHAAAHLRPGEAASSTVPWALAAELLVALALALFPVVVLYQQWASHMVRERRATVDDPPGRGSEAESQPVLRTAQQVVVAGIETLGLKGFLVLGAGLGLLAFVLVMFADRDLGGVAWIGALVAGAAMCVGWWSAQAAQRRSPRLTGPVVVRLVLALTLALSGTVTLFLEQPGPALVVAVVVALSPTGWQLWHCLRENRRLQTERRRRLDEEGMVENPDRSSA